MTPRQADVAFVLEEAPGVVEVHALERIEGRGDLEFAVKLAHGCRPVALAHVALLRVLSHDDCRSILFYEVDLPGGLRARASRLELSAAEREDSRARVPETSAALEQLPTMRRWSPTPAAKRESLRALIVDSDSEVHRAVQTALGQTAECVVEPDTFTAFWKAKKERFDLVLCDSRLAFGRQGFLGQLLEAGVPARHVVIVAYEGERELVVTSIDELRCWNSVLCRPIEPETLREILDTGSIIQRWRIPVLSPRQPRAAGAREAGTVRRVVIVDDDATTQMIFRSKGDDPLEVLVTTDEWEAVDLVRADEVALVVCSVSMKTLGGTPFYRLLWNARPDIKRRFVFIARPDAVPSSAAAGRAAPVIERPLTREAIQELVERFASGSASTDAP
jgi:DNA-binding NarL/FixJ family response regulator